MHRNRRISKADLIARMAAMDVQLIRLQIENEQLKDTIIRVSVKTDLGVKPIYQATIEASILMTIFAGGNGIYSMTNEYYDLPVIEVVSTYRPTLSMEDERS